jgi:hypothetical protein
VSYNNNYCIPADADARDGEYAHAVDVTLNNMKVRTHSHSHISLIDIYLLICTAHFFKHALAAAGVNKNGNPRSES